MPFSSTQPPEDITKCPKCASHAFYVLETRSNRDYTRRRRHCRKCEYRSTFYEVSQERYQKLQEDSKALNNLLRQLEGLLAGRGAEPVKSKLKQTVEIPCDACDYANNGECSFSYPEAFTPEAHDCSMFTEEYKNANPVK